MPRWTVLSMLMIGAGLCALAQNDAPKRTIFDSSNMQGKPQAPAPLATTKAAPPARDAGSTALDALITSTENLNNIRDSNVRRLGEGCSPEAAARITEIRTQLGIKTGPDRKDGNSETALLAVAAGWFKSAPTGAAPMTAQPKANLLDDVLPGSANKGQDAASLETELSRLLASCNGAKR